MPAPFDSRCCTTRQQVGAGTRCPLLSDISRVSPGSAEPGTPHPLQSKSGLLSQVPGSRTTHGLQENLLPLF